MEELVDVVNEKDEVIGFAPRKGIHETKLLHRGICIFVFNENGKLWIEKRAEHCDTYPGYYNSSVTGHVSKGETYEQAAKRELEEEFGIKIKLKRLHKIKTSHHLIDFFSGVSSEKPRIHSNTSELILLSIKEIEEMIKKEEKFTPNFLELFSWLVKNKTN
jgi:isopentenyl-diphosphate delta-isomerase type 1